MEYFIDTNIFVRILEFEDQEIFDECSKLLSLVKNSKIGACTSTTVLAEMVWVLSSVYKESKTIISKSINGILKLNNLEIRDEFDISKTMDFYSDHTVKFIDALIASNPKIQSKKMAVISYDKDFDKLGVKRLEPSDIINRG